MWNATKHMRPTHVHGGTTQPRTCLLSKKFRVSALWHFRFYLINIIQLWSN